MPALHFKTYGQGDPIIVLHGLFGTLDNWQTVARKLSENYLVYLIDQRNHGKSPHTDSFDYQDMADDVNELMNSEGIPEAHILGHSMGGKTAMQLSMSYPEKVRSLIVVDIAPKAYQGGHQEIFDALFSLDLSTIESRKAADEQLQLSIPDFGVRQFLLKNLTRQKTGGYGWKMNLSVIYESYAAILATIEITEPFENPTLFIRGERSKYISDKDEENIKKTFPTATIITISDAGHWLHAEQPEALLDAINAFINA